MYVRPDNLRSMLINSANVYKDKTAVLYKQEHGKPYFSVSYKTLLEDVTALYAALSNLHVKRAALVSENRYEWCLAYLAMVCGIGIIVPIDKELPADEIQNLIAISKSDTVIFSSKVEKKITGINTKRLKNFICMDPIIASKERNRSFHSLSTLLIKGRNLISINEKFNFEAVKINPNATMVILFTSGTTGVSKGVMLSHKNITTNIVGSCERIKPYSTDVFLSVLPAHHTYECSAGFLLPIYIGATIAYCEGLKYIVQNMREAKATIMLGVPALFENMYNKIWQTARKDKKDQIMKIIVKINSMTQMAGFDFARKAFNKLHTQLGGKQRLFISGGAAINPDVIKGFRELGFGMIQGYGLTETSPILSITREQDTNFKAVGEPLDNIDMKIANPDENGIGEIIVKGDSIMLGYYQDKAETAKAIKKGWFYTGDLGYIDKDGALVLTGRKKNIIVTKNGKNIYREELEFYIDKSQFVSENVIDQNDINGETNIVAYIFPDFEKIEETLGVHYTKEQVYSIIDNEIRAINKRIPIYKRINSFEIRETPFEKTTTHKIKRTGIKKA